MQTLNIKSIIVINTLSKTINGNNKIEIIFFIITKTRLFASAETHFQL